MLDKINLLIVFIFCISMCGIATLFQFMFNRMEKNYKALLKIEEREILTLKQNFESLLRDKKIETDRRKKVEQQLRLALAKTKESENTETAVMQQELLSTKDSLLNSRRTLEMVGRIGTVTNDFWFQYCVISYKRIVEDYIKSIFPKIVELLEIQLKNRDGGNFDKDMEVGLESIEKIKISLENICKNILNNTEIVPALVEEMFFMVDKFYEHREEYFISSGPVPLAYIDKDFVDGEIFKQILTGVINTENLHLVQSRLILTHLVNVLLYPLSLMQQQINNNTLENLLADTGYIIFDIRNQDSGEAFNLFIPAAARNQLFKSTKAFSKNLVNKSMF